MKLKTTVLSSLIIIASSSAALASEPSDLLGYTPGAQVVSITPVQPQLRSVTGIVYKQVITKNAVRKLEMTFLSPDNDVLKPCIVYFPGGGFSTAEHDKYVQLRTALAEAGFAVAAIEYRTVPDKYPALIEDAKAAIRYLRAHAAEFKIDHERIGVVGDSAGGYLSMMVAATNGEKTFDVGENLDQSSDIQAAVSFYGISDLLSIGEGFPEELRKVHESPAVTESLLINGAAFNTFPGASVFETPDKTKAASPLYHVDGSEPPMLLLHGAQDLLVSPLQSAKLYEAMTKAGADVEYILVENAKHGDLPWYQEAVINKVTAYLADKLGLKNTAMQDGMTL